MRRSRQWLSALRFGLFVGVLLCALSAHLPAQGPDFSNLVFLGDSLTAGFRNGTLASEAQQAGYAARLARQMNALLFLPLVDPQFLPELKLLDPQFPFTVQNFFPNPAIFPRLYPFVFASNLGVPGFTLDDALTYVPDESLSTRNLMPLLVFGIPTVQTPFAGRTQLQMAELYQPSFMVVWLGNNDALGAATNPIGGRLTPPDVFRRQYTELIGRLHALRQAYGTKIVAANIPDVTAVAALSSPEKLSRYLGRSVAEINALLGLRAGDFVTPDSLRFVNDIMAGRLPGPLPSVFVLRAERAATIRATIAQYNATIKELSETYADFRFPVVDSYAIFNDLLANGYTLGGVRLTTDFLGGIFSLDGVHPSATGYALLTNYFVDAINNFYGTAIPRISEAELIQIMSQDPLAPVRAKTDGEAPPILAMTEDDYKALCDRMLGGPRPDEP